MNNEIEKPKIESILIKIKELCSFPKDLIVQPIEICNDAPNQPENCERYGACLKCPYHAKRKTKIYISGKITGIEEEAAHIFESASSLLQIQGYEIINPMTLPHNHDKSWESYMREDLKALLDCDSIYMLNGWNDSKGANLEYHIAISLGLEVIYEK
jgi:hypothetical protein